MFRLGYTTTYTISHMQWNLICLPPVYVASKHFQGQLYLYTGHTYAGLKVNTAQQFIILCLILYCRQLNKIFAIMF